ncbi:Uncharacterised protein [Salmonella enterica subsp. enterica]|uniref:Uncharacterized protein n=1 Tax=Salmonella enterica I TaxID=59201 RepID=A0A379WWH0_SALET|nr:Uncharacterised protein [Salmonella enterica subsp. enterica]
MSQNGLRFTLDVDGLTPTATAVVGFPSSGINSSTGASWNQNERLKHQMKHLMIALNQAMFEKR